MEINLHAAQFIHADSRNPGSLAREPLVCWDFSVLVATRDDTHLIIGDDNNTEPVTLKRGQAIIFGGDFRHGGAGVECKPGAANLRLHFHLACGTKNQASSRANIADLHLKPYPKCKKSWKAAAQCQRGGWPDTNYVSTTGSDFFAVDVSLGSTTDADGRRRSKRRRTQTHKP